MPHLTTYIVIIVIVIAAIIVVATIIILWCFHEDWPSYDKFSNLCTHFIAVSCVYSLIQSLYLAIILFQWLFFIQLRYFILLKWILLFPLCYVHPYHCS